MGSSAAPGPSAGKQAAAAAKQAAGRAALAIGSGLLSGSRLIAKGVRAALADNSDKEPIRFLKFAELEWCADGGSEGSLRCCCCGGGGGSSHRHLPVLLVGLSTGFQVWHLDGANPAELVSRRDGPVKLLEVLPQPRCSADEDACDALCGDRPLLAVVPGTEHPPGMAYSSAGRAAGAGAAQHAQCEQQQQHIVQLFSLRSHGYMKTLSFSSEVLGLQASGRLLVVALRGQLQAFDAATLQHTFSCLTYVPPPPSLRQTSRGAIPAAGRRQPTQQQFVTEGLSSSTSSVGSEGAYHHQQAAGSAPGDASTAPPPAAALAPFALGPRWLAYAADTPVPAATGQAVAQRLPLARRDSAGSRANGGAEGEGSGGAGLTRAAVADAALQAAAKGGQQLRAGLAAVGSASFRYLSQQYTSWRQGPLDQAQQQREADAAEADAAVAGTVVVRDATSRLVVAHFRAHTSPLAALQFSPCGRLLATASTAGHSINVFRIVPPPPLPGSAAGDESSLGGGLGAAVSSAGHAVWLYRLYRGVTPAAIRGIAFAPDASWMAVSSGRGTTHLFYTPAVAPGATATAPTQQQQQQAGEVGETAVLGCPHKQPAAGRARKPGLLSGGVAGAATSAARNLYAGQSADVEPIAAAFLAAGPGSPKAVAPAASGAGGSLYVVTSDGLLTRHLLLAPPAAAASAGGAAGSTAAAQNGSAAAGLERQDSAAAATAGTAAAAVMEEADRWDVARHASWPEREELLPGLLDSSPAHTAPCLSEQQQLWAAQADSGALSAGEGGSAAGAAGAAGAAPLWRDPQFRCYEIQVQGLHVASAGLAAAADAAPGDAEGLAARLQAADVGGGGGGVKAPWLEDLPTRPVEPPQ